MAPQRVYLATAQAHDEEMRERIAQHRRDRGPDWHTIEEPLAIPTRLPELGPVVLVDCLTLWLTNLMLAGTNDLHAEFAALRRAIETSPHDIVLVTNEVGMGIVPPSALGRAFRDHAGILAQSVAAVCDEVVLVAAGLPLHLKGAPIR